MGPNGMGPARAHAVYETISEIVFLFFEKGPIYMGSPFLKNEPHAAGQPLFLKTGALYMGSPFFEKHPLYMDALFEK